MIGTGKLSHVPAVDGNATICRKCFNSTCTCSKLIISCKCTLLSVIHEDCLVEEIQSSPQLVTTSQTHPNFKEYKCPSCNQGVLFRPDFSSQRIACSDYTRNEYCIWVLWILIYLIYLGMICYFIYKATESNTLIAVWIVLIVLFMGVIIFFIWLQFRILQAKFYMQS